VSTKGKALNFSNGQVMTTTGQPISTERWLMRRLLSAMGDPPLAIVLWNGEEITTCRGTAEVKLHIRDRRAFWGILLDPDLYFGDAYSEGRIEVEGSLLRVIEVGTVHRPAYLRDGSWLARLLRRAHRAPQGNSLTGSRRNIHHHYDLSNKFYSLWLDREHMQYTCAYYPAADATLDQAQTAKLHHVCRKVRLSPGDTVIETGCGWGGLARFMALEYGAKVRAYNISHEQVAFATERARREGFADRVEYIEDDYRNASGECDVFVSVGMLEHVGTRHYHDLGATIDRCLREDGRGLIHSIGRNRPNPMNQWIEKRIFPGAYPPSLFEMSGIFEKFNFSVLDVENLRLHYARTLEHWLERFEANRNAVHDMFDERFVRAWRLYLTGSIAAFRFGDLQLFQVVFNRGDSNDVPWTREHLYQ